MNPTQTPQTAGNRVNRRRQSPARALGAALGRIVGFPPDPDSACRPTPLPSLAASWPRLVIG
jgi:hypothetical protein